MPERVQQRRVNGWRKPENTVSVARPTQYGNPFRVGDWFTPTSMGPEPYYDAARSARVRDRAHAVDLFRDWVIARREFRHDRFGLKQIQLHLAGKNLMCFCPLDQPCHADVLLELANHSMVSEDDRG